MKDFGRWLADQGRSAELVGDGGSVRPERSAGIPESAEIICNPQDNTATCYWGGYAFEWSHIHQDWVYECFGCGEPFPINCHIYEFDHHNHYCGKDQHCCP